MTSEAIQDLMRSSCFGCGSENEVGLQIKSFWDGEQCVCTWTPEPFHDSGGGTVYGGMLACVIDCHACMTAIAAAHDAEGREPDSESDIWYVTANLNIDYLAPAPLGVPLRLIAKVESSEGRKMRVACSLEAEGKECAKGTGLFIRVTRAT